MRIFLTLPVVSLVFLMVWGCGRVTGAGTVTNDFGMTFVRIPEGSHVVDGQKVVLRSFYLGKTEVTQKQWQQVMGNNPSEFQNQDNRPVERVSLVDVQQFVEKLNELTGEQYRLPGEAEWIHAARGGSQDDLYGALNEIAFYAGNSGMTTHPVGQKKANAYGLHDMLGNVYEWCRDDYSASDRSSPEGERSTALCVVKGGSWFSVERNCRPAHRLGLQPGSRAHDLGFRLLMETQEVVAK